MVEQKTSLPDYAIAIIEMRHYYHMLVPKKLVRYQYQV